MNAPALEAAFLPGDVAGLTLWLNAEAGGSSLRQRTFHGLTPGERVDVSIDVLTDQDASSATFSEDFHGYEDTADLLDTWTLFDENTPPGLLPIPHPGLPERNNPNPGRKLLDVATATRPGPVHD